MSQLIGGIPFWKLSKAGNQEQAAYEAERLAMATATEMLLPWKYRDKLDSYAGRGMDHEELGAIFNVPKYIVSNMLCAMHHPMSAQANKEAAKRLKK